MKSEKKSEKKFESHDAIEIMLNGAAMCMALETLVTANEAAIARRALRAMWKSIMMDEASGNKRHTLELVIDEFFNASGDMAGAARTLRACIQEKCPAPLWERTQDKLAAMRDAYLREIRSANSSRVTP